MKKWIKRLKPWMFENSKVPVWLSYISIEIGAISFGPFVSRMLMDDRLRRHETIHFTSNLSAFSYSNGYYTPLLGLWSCKHRGNGAQRLRNPLRERSLFVSIQ